MPKYTSFDPDAEIMGRNMIAFINSTQQTNILPILEKHNLSNVDADTWYPLQSWLDVLSDISEQDSSMLDFVNIGMILAETSVVPPGAEELPFEEFILGLDDTYQLQHRNGEVGVVEVEKVEENHIKITARIPYPIDLEYGLAYGFARRFLPDGTHFTVDYEQPDQSEASDGNIIHVRWN